MPVSTLRYVAAASSSQDGGPLKSLSQNCRCPCLWHHSKLLEAKVLSPEPNTLAPRHRSPLIFLPPFDRLSTSTVPSSYKLVNSRADLDHSFVRLPQPKCAPDRQDPDPETTSNQGDPSSYLAPSTLAHPGIPDDNNLIRPLRHPRTCRHFNAKEERLQGSCGSTVE